MSVKRRDLVRYLEDNSFYLLREGGNHSIYTNGAKTIPVKRHRIFDRITANEICKQQDYHQSFKLERSFVHRLGLAIVFAVSPLAASRDMIHITKDCLGNIFDFSHLLLCVY